MDKLARDDTVVWPKWGGGGGMVGREEGAGLLRSARLLVSHQLSPQLRVSLVTGVSVRDQSKATEQTVSVSS